MEISGGDTYDDVYRIFYAIGSAIHETVDAVVDTGKAVIDAHKTHGYTETMGLG